MVYNFILKSTKWLSYSLIFIQLKSMIINRPLAFCSRQSLYHRDWKPYSGIITIPRRQVCIFVVIAELACWDSWRKNFFSLFGGTTAKWQWDCEQLNKKFLLKSTSRHDQFSRFQIRPRPVNWHRNCGSQNIIHPITVYLDMIFTISMIGKILYSVLKTI